MSGEAEVIARSASARIVLLPFDGPTNARFLHVPSATVFFDGASRLVLVEVMRQDLLGGESWEVERNPESAARAALAAVANIVANRRASEREGGAT